VPTDPAKFPANTKTINDFGHLGYNSGTSGSGLPLGDRVASHLSSSHVVRFADFEFDLRSGELSRNGTSLKLQPQPAKVLTLLVSRHGEIVTRQDIAQHVWGSETFVDFEQGLNFAIRQIRSVLQDDADHPRFLQTLPKRGYRFTAKVIIHPLPPEIETPALVSPATPSPRRRVLRYWLAGVAVAVAAAHGADRAASAVRKLGHGRSSVVTRSVSVAVFRRRSSLSTSLRTEVHRGGPQPNCGRVPILRPRR